MHMTLLVNYIPVKCALRFVRGNYQYANITIAYYRSHQQIRYRLSDPGLPVTPSIEVMMSESTEMSDSTMARITIPTSNSFSMFSDTSFLTSTQQEPRSIHVHDILEVLPLDNAPEFARGFIDNLHAIFKYSAPPLICQLWDLANCWQNRGVAN